MKTITVGNTHGLQQGKTAIATTLTRADTYRAGEQWRPARNLPHNTSVEAVNHFGRHMTERGDILRVVSIEGPAVQIEVQDIRAVETDKLTDQDFQALGYRDRADYMADWGDVFGSRIWLMKIRRL